MIELRSITQAELNSQIQAVASAASRPVGSISADDFLFVACFDGTNNDRTDLDEAGDKIDTNVSGLYEMCARIDGNVVAMYYAGPGTDKAILFSDALPYAVTAEINKCADTAYTQFAEAACAWLLEHPDKSAEQAILVATTGFSRGCATAVRFCQLLNERGLKAGDGSVLAAPGTITVEAAVMLDPVTTGYSGNLSVPSNVNLQNFISFQARDELRYAFKAATFGAGAAVLSFVGNHGDVGGAYVNEQSTPYTLHGLGALAFEAQVNFFRSAGIPLGAIPAHRAYDGADLLTIHTEGVDSFGHVIWSTYGDVGTQRLTTQVGVPLAINSEPSFVYSAGQGSITIKPDGALHTLVINDVAYAKIEFFRKENDLLLRMPGADQLTIKNWFICPVDAKPLKNIVVGSEWWGVDSIFSDAPLLLEGSSGADSLKIGALPVPSAEFFGGLGSDTLVGGVGSDTYVYRKGDGNDTITLGGGNDTLALYGLSSDELKLTQDGSAAVIELDDGAYLRVTDLFSDTANLYFNFEDNSKLTLSQSQYDTNAYEVSAQDGAGIVRLEQTIVKDQGNYGTRYAESGLVTSWYSSTDGYRMTNITYPDGATEGSGSDPWGGFWSSKYSADRVGYYISQDGAGGYYEAVNYSEVSGYSKYQNNGGYGYSVFDGSYYISESFSSWGYNLSWQKDGQSYSKWSGSGGWGIQKYDGSANYALNVSSSGSVSASATWNDGTQFNRYTLASGGVMYTWKASSGDFAWQYTNSGDIALNYGVKLADGTQTQFAEFKYGGTQLTRYSPIEGNFSKDVFADGSIFQFKSTPAGSMEWLRWNAQGSLYYYATGQAGSSTLQLKDTTSMQISPAAMVNPVLPAAFQSLRDNFESYLVEPSIDKPSFSFSVASSMLYEDFGADAGVEVNLRSDLVSFDSSVADVEWVDASVQYMPAPVSYEPQTQLFNVNKF